MHWCRRRRRPKIVISLCLLPEDHSKTHTGHTATNDNHTRSRSASGTSQHLDTVSFPASLRVPKFVSPFVASLCSPCCCSARCQKHVSPLSMLSTMTVGMMLGPAGPLDGATALKLFAAAPNSSMASHLSIGEICSSCMLAFLALARQRIHREIDRLPAPHAYGITASSQCSKQHFAYTNMQAMIGGRNPILPLTWKLPLNSRRNLLIRSFRLGVCGAQSGVISVFRLGCLICV